jgi:hypothetical protein
MFIKTWSVFIHSQLHHLFILIWQELSISLTFMKEAMRMDYTKGRKVWCTLLGSKQEHPSKGLPFVDDAQMCTPDRRISLCSLFLIHNLGQELAFVPHAYLVPFSFNHPIKLSVKIFLSNCSHLH